MKKIRRDDTVQVITGESRGMRGQVLRMEKKGNRVVVQGVNLAKVHEKRTQQRDGGIIEREAPLHLSNVALVCPRCDKPSRVGIREDADGRAMRYCKSCDEVIE